jgi:hypothetical protein
MVMGMYKSPIELLVTNVYDQIQKEQDEHIYQAVLQYVPNVDRAELIRALQYDRNQYEKGYMDGKRDAEAALTRCKDCKHNVANKEHDPLDITDYTDIVCDYWMNDGNLPDDFCSYGERKDNERKAD